MKVLAISGSYHPAGNLFHLVEAVLQGARAAGAMTKHVTLLEQHVEFCTNCMTCLEDREAAIGPCPLDDDVRSLIEAALAADALVLGSPINMGSVTALMKRFMERAIVMGRLLPAREAGTALADIPPHQLTEDLMNMLVPVPRRLPDPSRPSIAVVTFMAPEEAASHSKMVEDTFGQLEQLAGLLGFSPVRRVLAGAVHQRPVADDDSLLGRARQAGRGLAT